MSEERSATFPSSVSNLEAGPVLRSPESTPQLDLSTFCGMRWVYCLVLVTKTAQVRDLRLRLRTPHPSHRSD